MEGLKYKLAHKRAEIGKWSSTDYAQKERLIQILFRMHIILEHNCIYFGLRFSEVRIYF